MNILIEKYTSGYGELALAIFAGVCLVFLLARERRWTKAWAAPILLLLWGLVTLFLPSLSSGFELLPGDNGDGRLNHYFLEHGWRWISGNPLHASFWDAPFFYPHRNVMAWSDILLGSAPFYWAARLSGMDAFNAYLFWGLCLGAANFLSMFFFLRRAMGFSSLSSGLGAFLFAFCAPRLQKFGHIQMWPQYYSVLFMWCVHAAYHASRATMFRGRALMSAAALCFVLQCYAGFYLGWFLAFGTAVFLGVSLCFAETRRHVWELMRLHYPWLLFCLGFSLLLLFPMAAHYLQAQALHGERSFNELLNYMPDVRSWLNSPAVVYEKLNLVAARNGEHLIGIGAFTLLLCLFGLNTLRRAGPWGRCLALSLPIIFILSLHVYGGVLWKFLVFSWIPGASAIRALCRIFYLTLLVLPIGVAFALENKRFRIQVVLVLLCLAESLRLGYFHYDRSRVHTVSAAIAAEAVKYDGPFLFLPVGDYSTGTDCMWAALLADRPTLNGYSGWEPPGYHSLRDPLSSEASSYLSKLGEFLLILPTADGGVTSLIVRGSDSALAN